MDELRPSSRISRQLRPDGAVYVKQYLVGDAYRTREVIQERTARETDVLQRLATLYGMKHRLGVPTVASADPERAELSTLEVPGKPLQDVLLSDYSSKTRLSCLSALYLAGKWLRVFQTLAPLDSDFIRLNQEPEDLVQYCELRLKSIADSAYGWPAQTTKRCLDHLHQCIQASHENDRRKVWSHCDYGPWNMLWDGKTLTPIDFEMCRLDLPLVDVTHFIHRLEMLSLRFPWRRWPIAAWKQCFLRGYGRPDAAQSPMYQALMVRHLLCRLVGLIRRPGEKFVGRLHNAWLRRRVQAQLQNHLAK